MADSEDHGMHSHALPGRETAELINGVLDGTSHAASSGMATNRSNTEILTHSHTVLKAKARAKKNQIEAVVFDDTARRCVLYPSSFWPRRV